MRAAAVPLLMLCTASSLPAGMPAKRTPRKPAPAPLYSRVGGVYGIAEIADAFIERVWDDEVLLQNPGFKAAHDRLTKAAVKFHLASKLCQAAGGPCTFEAKGGAPAAAALKLAPDEWHALRNHWFDVLEARGLAEAERNEMVALLDTHLEKIRGTADDFALG